MFSAKKITLPLLLSTLVAVSIFNFNGLSGISIAAPADSISAKTPAKAAALEKSEKKEEKKEAEKKSPEPDLINAVSVTPEELVKHPHEYLGKNVKFNANFFAFSNLALDYKPAYRSSKTHLSLLVLTPGTHVPLSELKLAMMIPKDKDPETDLLAKLKDGDQIEIIGKEFSTALDDPWVEIYKLKKIGSSKEEDTDKEKASASDRSPADKAKENDHHPDVEGK